MKELLTRVKQIIIRKQYSLKIISVYNSILIFFTIVFYYLTPILFNVAPGFDQLTSNSNNRAVQMQYIVTVAIALIGGNAVFLKVLKGVDDWQNLSSQHEGTNINAINSIRKKCFNLPYIIFLVQLGVPFITICLMVAITAKMNNVSSFSYLIRLVIAIASFATLISVISIIFAKRIFRRILMETFKGETAEGIRIQLKNKIFLQIIPMFIVTVVFTSLLGYSRLVGEKEEFVYQFYKSQLQRSFNDMPKVENIKQIQDRLKEIHFDFINSCNFIINPEGEITTSTGCKLSAIFLEYMNDYSIPHDALIAEHTGWGAQGAVIVLKGDTGDWKVGIKYEITSSEKSLIFFIISFIVLLGLNIFVLNYFSKSLAEDISLVTVSLNEIAEGVDVQLGNKLSVTSNDEIGDLAMAFNRIQEREKEYIRTIEENQTILMERERLASLGQLIGGISHNLKTPIMSMAGGLEALKDLVNELDESVDDENVTKEDYHEIAGEMDSWIEKMKSYSAYMSDVITAVKGQAVHLSDSSSESFTLDELVKRVDILMKQEIIKNDCTLNKDFRVDMATQIKGEVNNLVQILNNLITNAIDSFEGKRGTIDFGIARNGKTLEFIIKDYGKGIPQEIQDKLLKEMVTTKGKKGTGLGLYMSNATIKGKFGGSVWFESEEGKGTTFYISIPYLV